MIREAIECRRAEKAPEKQARALAELRSYLFCRGFATDGHKAIAEAADLVVGRSEGCELAWVLHAQARFSGDPPIKALDVVREAVAVAERCGDGEIIAESKVTLGRLELSVDFDTGKRSLDRIVSERDGPGSSPQAVARALTGLGVLSRAVGRSDLGHEYMAETLAYCETHNLDLWRINGLACMVVAALEDGRWTEAADAATRVLDDPRDSPWPHVKALLVLALVRARRGDPDARVPLDEALGLDIPREELMAIDDRAVTHAEIAWLERRLDEIDAATAASFGAAVARKDTSAICQLGYWRRLAGLDVDVPDDADDPLALCLGGAWEEAAVEWARLDRPYEAALARAETGKEELLRRAYDELQAARRTPRRTTRVTAIAGARCPGSSPRTRAATRESPAGLTARELDVLALLANGLRNAQIAERLVISPRTVDHHVSAILRKLQSSTRDEAVARAGELGLLEA
ncbi:MAG: LuxR C-terminal-related transcriptional regulator [Thermoleophilia bacterium]|nr:LuxR C-terminal-related transcriptional regulator [Thermoleophilia bacterium]